MSDFIGILLMTIGVLFDIFGCIGLVRLPDIYNRLQGATKCVTVGTCMILVGAMVLVDCPACVLKCLICLVFILITSPAAAHALARGSHSFGVELCEISVIDKYAEDKKIGKEESNKE